ncbi:MAG: sodium:proton antiporter [Deltaproteobacteria bacterium]|nr:MAG: sodium:proton antiporter [Deltaproteobacteria bacterium]
MNKFVAVLQEYSLPLLAGVVTAVAWANLDHASYEAVAHHIHFAVNDVFMVFFFAIAAGEIVESCLPGGALNPPSKAINPLVATVGGVVGPAAVFLAWSYVTGDAAIRGGWGIPTATDIALAWLVARAVFGKGHPAVSFLLLLAIADDAIGLVIIAVFYPDPAHPVQPVYLALVAAAMVGAYGLRRAGFRSFWAYLAGPGVVSWLGLKFAGVHPALALVFVVPFMPTAGHDEGVFADSEEQMHDTLNRFQHAFRLPVDLGLFAFGLANAGVVFAAVGNATWAVLAGLAVGKTGGIWLASTAAHAVGFRRPEGLSAATIGLVGLVGALGLTVALFVAGVAYTDPAITAAAKMGALLSIGVAPVAVAIGWLRRRAVAGAPAASAAATSAHARGSVPVPVVDAG